MDWWIDGLADWWKKQTFFVYAHKAFFETEYSNGKEAKDTWLRCQGYTYEQHPGNSTTTQFTNRELESRQSGELTFFGKVAADVFSRDKHLLSGVTLRTFFVRSKPEFVLINKITITQVNLYARKMTVSEQVFIAIEKTLTKTPALYRYTEVLPKTFLIPTGSRSWSKEDVFSREPVRQFALALVSNASFLGSKDTNPFHYQKHNLNEVTVYRNGYPVAGTPLATDDLKRVYLSTMDALAFGHHGHGHGHGHGQQASHDFLYSELTNAAISLELKFSAALAVNSEVFLLGEKASIIYIGSHRKVSKNVMLNPTT